MSVRVRAVTRVVAALVVAAAGAARADDPKPPAPTTPPAPAAKPAPAADKDADPPLDAAAQKQHDDQVAFWLKRLRGEKNREQVRLQIEQMGREPNRAVRDALIAFATGNSNQEFVTHAFRALSSIKGKTVVEFLCGREALRSRDFLVQVSAAESLGSMRDARAVDALVEVASSSSVKSVAQAACVDALAACSVPPAPAVSELWFRLAEAKADNVRASALQAVGLTATDEAVKVLTAHLKSEKNSNCRGAAATGLGNTKRKDVVPVLEAALAADDSLVVREAIDGALRRLR